MTLFSYLFALILIATLSNGDQLSETLFLKPLPNRKIAAHFEFEITDALNSTWEHTRLFPRPISEILLAHSVEELHFSLTQGHWSVEIWGKPFVAVPTGAHVVAWLLSKETTKQDDDNWRGLTSRLSGLTCASLNFLNEKTSFQPAFSYRPFGNINITKSVPRVGSLPREHLCTENLTPWAKQLPCGLSRGLASLLRSKRLFHSHYLSSGIHFVKKVDKMSLKFHLTSVMEVSGRVKPSEYFVRNSFDSVAHFPCFMSSRAVLKIWSPQARIWLERNAEDVNLLKISDVLPKDITFEDARKELIFTAKKYIGGYGLKYGELIVEMRNHLRDKFLTVGYLEVLPWFVRPYLHTMKMEVQHEQTRISVSSENDQRFHYTPGRDREALHKLEMDVSVPPSSTLFITFTIEKGHLKWDEYPPDANHGFYLDAAHFEVNIKDEKTGFETIQYYYTRILLINLSTPDFSMPYNVICLTCTAVALSFGPIHNITTKQLQLTTVVPKFARLKKFLRRLIKRDKDSDESEECSKISEVSPPISEEDSSTAIADEKKD